jgi:AraC-like DNA-binding protein
LNVDVERHEAEHAEWEVARRDPPAHLRRYVFGCVEGWAQASGPAAGLREVPFPGVPLIFNFGPAWKIAASGSSSRRFGSFVAGLSTSSSFVHGADSWACVEVRLTPLGARRVLGVPMSELTDQTVELEDVLPEARELEQRLGETEDWSQRLDLAEAFLTRRLAGSRPTRPEIEWSWGHLYRSRGRAPIGRLREELGWSHRRMIRSFREQVGLAPKLLARVIRFDRAVAALRSSGSRTLAEIAFDCGYADQAHLNREFREFAGVSPTEFVAAQLESGGIAA